MTDCCPNCGRPLPDADPAGRLRRWCAEHGHTVLPDGSVYEATAAAILDRSGGTLRNWRSTGAGSPLPFYRHGRTGRVRYRLADLAELLEASRVDE